MSGHSKWAKIRHKKGANDAKRGALFTKLAKAITIAASEGGGDPDMNFTLRLAIDKAKKANMPIDNIDRAVKKGTGEGGEGTIQRIVYEGVGPEGTFFIVSCSTDNTNRTVAELRKLFEAGGGNLGTSGTAMWQFSEMGVIIVKPERLKKAEKFGKDDSYEPIDIDELQLELIDIDGVKDIVKSENEDGEDVLEIKTDKNDFAKVHKLVEAVNIAIQSAELQFVPNDFLKVNSGVEGRVLSLME